MKGFIGFPILLEKDRRIKHGLLTYSAHKNDSFRDVGVPRSDPIASGMKHERFALAPLVFLNFANENNMIATVKLANIPTNKVGSGPFQQRASGGSV